MSGLIKLSKGCHETCVFGKLELIVEWFRLTIKHINKPLLVSIQLSTHHGLHQGYSAEREKGTI